MKRCFEAVVTFLGPLGFGVPSSFGAGEGAGMLLATVLVSGWFVMVMLFFLLVWTPVSVSTVVDELVDVGAVAE